MLQKIFSILNSVLGLLISLIPFILFPVCENLKPDGNHMNCFYSGIFITSMGILILIFSILSLSKKFSFISKIISAISALMCWLVPNEIIRLEIKSRLCGLCGNVNHACRANTMPTIGFLISLVIFIIILSLTLKFVKGDN